MFVLSDVRQRDWHVRCHDLIPMSVPLSIPLSVFL
jgi:hypothetical protein